MPVQKIEEDGCIRSHQIVIRVKFGLILVESINTNLTVTNGALLVETVGDGAPSTLHFVLDLFFSPGARICNLGSLCLAFLG